MNSGFVQREKENIEFQLSGILSKFELLITERMTNSILQSETPPFFMKIKL